MVLVLILHKRTIVPGWKGLVYKKLYLAILYAKILTQSGLGRGSISDLIRNLIKNYFLGFFQIVSECPQTRIMGFLHFLESKTSKGLLKTCVLNKILVFYLNFKKNRSHMYFKFIETRKSVKKASN